MRIRKTRLALALLYACGLLAVLVTPYLFPAKYFYDSATIQDLIVNPRPWKMFDSYANTAAVYRFLGFKSVFPDTVAAWMGYTLGIFFIAAVVKRTGWRWHPLAMAVVATWSIPMAVYLGQYSKEPLALTVAGTLLLLSRSNWGLLLGIVLVVLYATFFRIYWFIVLGFFLLNLIFLRIRSSLTKMIAANALAAFLGFHLVHLATGQYLTDSRFMLNINRWGDPDAVTAIQLLLPNTSSWTDLINSIYGWTALLVPVQLVSIGGLQHITFGLFQFVNVLLFVVSARHVLKHRAEIQMTIGQDGLRQMEVAVAWCIAYSYTQGIFEPDFGSFSRHQIILVPMLILLLMWHFGYWRRPRQYYLFGKQLYIGS